MNVTEISVKKPVTVSMIFLAVMLLSVIGFSRLGIDLLPDFSYPVLSVITTANGMGPREVEENISKKIEAVVGTVNNIKNIKSISAEGVSVVTIEFVWGANMAEAASDVREKIDIIRDKLPEIADKPITYKFDPSAIPVYVFVVGGVSMMKAKDYSKDFLKAELEQIEGVSAINVEGGRDRQIQIQVDRSRLLAYNFSFDQIVNILRAENVNQPAGEIKVGFNTYTIRTEGEYKTIEEIKKTVVGVAGTSVKKAVYLEDIATIKEGLSDKEEIRSVGRNEAITIACLKRSGENTVQIVDRIVQKLERVKKTAPRGIRFYEIFNQADYIKNSIGNVADSARAAGFLSILVVLLFLRNIRVTLIIALAIPSSVLVTFLFMYFGDLTLNMVSFGGLALGVGMLVDNSIVVLENIFRHKQMGEDKISAAINGTKEVAMPIIASTLTHVCVFLPLVFVRGASSIFFKQMALTVTFSLLASLFVAMTIIPMMSSKLIHIFDFENRQFKSRISTLLFRITKKFLDGLDGAYHRGVHWALTHRKTILWGVFALFIFSMFLFSFVQKGFLAEQDDNRINLTVELKEGTRLEVTEQFAYMIADKVKDVEGVELFFSQMGTAKNMFALAQGRVGSHLISSRINLVKKEKRTQTLFEIREKIRTILSGIPGIIFKFSQNTGFGTGQFALEIQVRGEDLEGALKSARKIESIIKKDYNNELKDVNLSRTEGQEELVLRINRVKAATLGFNVSIIANTIQNNFVGIAPTTYKIGKDEIDIVARLKENQRLTKEDLENVIIRSPLGFSVPISQVIDTKPGKAPSKIERINQERVVYVRANNMPDVGIVNVVDRLQSQVQQEVVFPEGIYPIYAGSYQDSQESANDLQMAFLLAICLIYMVMAAQFESLLNPFIIMFTIPLGMIGVSWAFFLSGLELNVNGYLGIIMLSGIVVNNGIIMIDYIRQLREIHGMELFEAIIAGGRTRLRPVVMTALTTILGMLPLALSTGPGSEVNKPLAVAVAAGLTVSTFLTLFFVPVFYSLFAGNTIRRRRIKLTKNKK